METPDFVPVAAPLIGEAEIALVTEAVRSGWVSSAGPFLARFEAEFARYIGVDHAISVSNGTVAIHLVLHALGIGSGDEVIVPDLTFAATAHAVLLTGATPVLVDVEADTWCVDPVAVERAITPRTRAIIAVHLFGHPCDMDRLSDAARNRGITVIEDAAEAHGAQIGSRRVGSFGRAGTFSFYGNKLLTTGEGGMVVTNDAALAHRLRFLKDHGMSPDRRYYHTEMAFNYRMTNLQAALGVAQLGRLDEFIEKKRKIMQWYREDLGGEPRLRLNAERSGVRSVFWMASALLTEAPAGARDRICTRLRAQGVDTRPFFVPMSELPHLAKCRTEGRVDVHCSVAAQLSRGGFNLPSGCGLERHVVTRITRELRAALVT